MLCKYCGKLISGSRCFYCGHQQKKTLADSHSLSLKKDEDMSEIPSFYDSNKQGVKQTSNFDNQQALISMILGICSLLIPMLSIPAFIVSIIALRAKKLNGASRSKAIVGLVTSCIIPIVYLVELLVYLLLVR